jgi:hypothetical protein
MAEDPTGQRLRRIRFSLEQVDGLWKITGRQELPLAPQPAPAP